MNYFNEKYLQKTDYLFFDEVYAMLLDGAIDDGMNLLFNKLRSIYNNSSNKDWQQFSRNECLKQPLTNLIHQDPFTLHSYLKPRGYPGDAALLDQIYYHDELPSETSLLGKNIWDITINSSAPSSVRTRRNILANTIDEIVATSTKAPKILSIACGHLREAQKSQAVQEGGIEEFIALDQDSLSITKLKEEQSNKIISPVCGSVRDILTKKLNFENLDFVYAAGLYDYLNDRTAARLTKIMFDMLNPGGTFLVANFTPVTPDIPYMKTFMQWELIYRTPSQLEKVKNGINQNTIAKQDLFLDESGNIAYLKLTKQ